MRYLTILLLSIFTLVSCKGKNRPTGSLYIKQDSVPQPKFQVLEFEADGKINSASIDTRYKNFGHKNEFPVSLFITINGKDKAKLDAFEKNIVDSLKNASLTAFLGHVNMPAFRDLIFYIKKEDQQKISNVLSKIKKQNPAIKEFVFEEDPKWEAVDEFFRAMK